MKISKWYIISWLCIVYSFVYDYIDIEIGIKKMIALICLIYILLVIVCSY